MIQPELDKRREDFAPHRRYGAGHLQLLSALWIEAYCALSSVVVGKQRARGGHGR